LLAKFCLESGEVHAKVMINQGAQGLVQVIMISLESIEVRTKVMINQGAQRLVQVMMNPLEMER